MYALKPPKCFGEFAASGQRCYKQKSESQNI